MTRPYTRACRQTNFSEGGFLNLVPFLFFFFLFLTFSLLFLTFFFHFCPLILMGPWPISMCVCGGGCPSDNTGEMGSQC